MLQTPLQLSDFLVQHLPPLVLVECGRIEACPIRHILVSMAPFPHPLSAKVVADEISSVVLLNMEHLVALRLGVYARQQISVEIVLLFLFVLAQNLGPHIGLDILDQDLIRLSNRHADRFESVATADEHVRVVLHELHQLVLVQVHHFD